MQEIIDTVNRYTLRGAASRDRPTPGFAARQFLCSLLLRRQLDSIRLSTIADYMFSTEALIVVSRGGIQTISCEGSALWPLCAVPNASTSEISGVAVTPRGTLVCSSNGICYLEGETPNVAENRVPDSFAQNVLCISCTPDGDYIATGGGTASITVWSSALEPLHHFAGHTDWVRCVRFARGTSPALQLFSTGDDGVICQWDVLAGSLISRVNYSCEDSIQFFEVNYYSGLIAIASNTNIIALYCPKSDNTTRAAGEDVLRLQPMALLLSAHNGTPTAGKFTDDSQWLASAAEDETITLTYLVDYTQYYRCNAFVTRRRCFSFMNIFNSICILAAPPTSSVIVVSACSSDGTVVQWVVDPRTGRSSYTKQLQLHLGPLLGMDLIPGDQLSSLLW
ncbi:WD domain, G-beta repeat [Novymonas esmeraldas]|uniref:WD domain, G-beta repeat n=1 Tax=Novymonas esmeraldas TaxID=1808958 RepID=A0AAW0EX21_9TRYP